MKMSPPAPSAREDFDAVASSIGHTGFPQILVNDVHSQLNPTFVRRVNTPASLDELQKVIERAHREHRPVCVAGGRHAGGGQQFATDAELIDARGLRRVLLFDPDTGTIEVEAGIQWPQLLDFLHDAQRGQPQAWTIAQKQTGTDRLTLGGSLSANAHGRGLCMPPLVSNIESFVLVDACGHRVVCSRAENSRLFRLAIGGYGLLGFIYSVKLRLVHRRKVRRIVTLINAEDLPAAFAARISDGFLYGDFQFAIDSSSNDFLRRGIFSCYHSVSDVTPVPTETRKLSAQDWKDLLYLAHTAPSRAFKRYTSHYLATSGQIYWSDTQYVSDYFEDYHRELDCKLRISQPGTEVIGELCVPREALPRFLNEARERIRGNEAQVIYGTIRLIERDDETFLAWARQPYACVIFNIHTPHTPAGQSRTARCFRQLIDIARAFGGTYYLTYHRYATREQLLACYPQFPEFLRLKLAYDPDERFQSDWYCHYKKLVLLKSLFIG
jgi:FAD/FMN-containing dehydrogenase